MKNILLRLRRIVSPVFITLFVASFILWYIAKLNYTYTADYVAKLNIDGHRIEVPCVVEGLGSNLLNHKFKIGKRLRIPLSELKTVTTYAEDSTLVTTIDGASLRNALSVHISDIKIISVGAIPPLDEK